MPGEDETTVLLREIRDLLANREQAYKEYLAASEELSEKMYAKYRQQNRATRILQWGALFFIVFCAVYLALQAAN